MGYPSALTARTWGYYDVLFKGRTFEFQALVGIKVVFRELLILSNAQRSASQRCWTS